MSLVNVLRQLIIETLEVGDMVPDSILQPVSTPIPGEDDFFHYPIDEVEPPVEPLEEPEEDIVTLATPIISNIVGYKDFTMEYNKFDSTIRMYFKGQKDLENKSFSLTDLNIDLNPKFGENKEKFPCNTTVMDFLFYFNKKYILSSNYLKFKSRLEECKDKYTNDGFIPSELIYDSICYETNNYIPIIYLMFLETLKKQIYLIDSLDYTKFNGLLFIDNIFGELKCTYQVSKKTKIDGKEMINAIFTIIFNFSGIDIECTFGANGPNFLTPEYTKGKKLSKKSIGEMYLYTPGFFEPLFFRVLG